MSTTIDISYDKTAKCDVITITNNKTGDIERFRTEKKNTAKNKWLLAMKMALARAGWY